MSQTNGEVTAVGRVPQSVRRRHERSLAHVTHQALEGTPLPELYRLAVDAMTGSGGADAAAVFAADTGTLLASSVVDAHYPWLPSRLPLPRPGDPSGLGGLDVARPVVLHDWDGARDVVVAVIGTAAGPCALLAAYWFDRDSVRGRSFAARRFVLRLADTLSCAARRLEREQGLVQGADRFVALVRSAPEAIVLTRADGRIVLANQEAERLFGYSADELVGQSVEVLLPEGQRERHELHRARYAAAPHNRPMGLGLDLTARRKDGTDFPVGVSLGVLEDEGGLLVAAFVSDLTERKRTEELTLTLHDADVSRRHALEINDRVVQGLATAVYALDGAKPDVAATASRRTLLAARTMMEALLAAAPDETRIEPGELVRTAVSAPRRTVNLPSPHPTQSDAIRILIADDADDLRTLLRLTIERRPGLELVAEAADGAQAVALAELMRPDVALLDLALPVMDGLEAIQVIRKRSPRTKIVVLSGFDAKRMRPLAIEQGADAYVEKGESMRRLVDVVARLCPSKPLPAQPQSSPADEAELARGEAGPLFLAHEVRGPLTVIQGLAETLMLRSDDLEPRMQHELLEAIERNGRHLGALVEAMTDAHRLGSGELALNREVIHLTAELVMTHADLQRLAGNHPLQLDTSGRPFVSADRVRLRQVLTNLVVNAAKFSPPRSPIDLTLVTVGRTAEVRVRDRGPGIPKERRDQLFGRHQHFGKPGHGMGLGLYLARGIARAHNGDLTLADDDSPGATFVLTLPTVAPPR